MNFKAICKIFVAWMLFPLAGMAQAPDWSVNPADYTNSMTVTAKLNAACKDLKNASNKIGAFVNGECRGVVESSVVVSGNYLAFLTVYSNASSGEVVTFKMYDADANAQITAITTVGFQNNASYGAPSEPFIVYSNNPPTDITLSNNTVAENAAGATIGTFSTADVDGGSFNYSLVVGSGDNNNNKFAISSQSIETIAGLNFEESATYSVRIKSSDVTASTCAVEKSFTITTTDINEAPANIILSNNSIFENATVGTTIGNFSTTDQDLGNTFTYSLVETGSYPDNALVSVNANGVLSSSASYNYEERTSLSIKVRSTDNGGLFFDKVFSIQIQNKNDKPSDITISSTSIAENLSSNTVVGTLSAIDQDLIDAHSFQFFAGDGNSNSSFQIVGNQLRTSQVFDYETKKEYFIYITARDQEQESFTKQFEINVTDVNDLPSDILLSNNSFSEDLPKNSVVGDFTTSDQDENDSFTYGFATGLGDNDNAAFYLANNQLRTNQLFDYNVKNQYTIRIKSTDAAGATIQRQFNINVLIDNDTPTDIQLSANTIAENKASGTLVGTLTTTDGDVGDSHTYSFQNTQGNNNTNFVIVGNELRTNTSFNFETSSIQYVYIKTTDIAGASYVEQFEIYITDDNDKPTDITLSNNSFSEDAPLGTYIGKLISTDEDETDTYSYTFVAGIGDEGNASFRISSDSLFTNDYFSFESKNTYSVRLRTTDLGGKTFEKAFSLSVLLDNDPPTNITLSNQTIAENLVKGSVIGQFTTTDNDLNDTHTYSFVNEQGNNNAQFVLVGNELRTDAVFNFEATKLYYIFVKSTDQIGGSVTKQFVINITNANDAPTDITLSNNSFSEDDEIGTFIGKFDTDDQDKIDTYNYAFVPGVGDAGNSKFRISTDSIFVNADFDASVQNQFSVRVRSTDGGGASVTRVFTMNVLIDNDAPTDILLSHDTILENAQIGTLIGTFSSVDPDNNDSHTYSFSEGQGNDNELFTIVGDQLFSDQIFNFENVPLYYVYVKSTDILGASRTEQFTIRVIDANDAPTRVEISNNIVTEDQVINSFVGKLNTVDPDQNDEFTYAFTNGVGDAGNGAFRISNDSLFTNQIFDLSVKDRYSILVRSQDAKGASVSTSFIIEVREANDPPTDIDISDDAFAENNLPGAQVGVFSTQDPDEVDNFQYALVSNNGTAIPDNAFFQISPTGALKILSKANFEIKSSYNIRVRSTDKGGLFVEKNFQISVTDINDAPSALAIAGTTVLENKPLGTAVGVFSTVDEDQSDVHTYSLTTNSQTSNTSFYIDGASLRTDKVFDFENKGVHTIEVRSTDAAGASFTKQLVINIVDAPDAPTNIGLSNNNFSESAAQGTLIGILSTEDQDAIDQFTYGFVSGAHNADNAAFQINGNKLVTKGPYDFNAQKNYTIEIKSTDNSGNTTSKLFSLEVKDANNQPTDILLSQNKVDENQSIGTLIGSLTATDVDAGDTHQFQLVTGTGSEDNAKFIVVGNQLLTNEILNFEQQETYKIRLRATDVANSFFEKALEIKVNDKADKPTDIIASNLNVNENQPSGTLIASLTTIDEDQSDEFSYSFDESLASDNRLFIIEGNQLLTLESFDYEVQSLFSVRIKTTDSDNLSMVKQMVIRVLNINDTPTAIVLSSNQVTENLSGSQFIGKLSSTDQDANDNYTYTFEPGIGLDNNAFSIVKDSLFLSGSANFELKPNYSIKLRSTDVGGLFTTTNFTVEVLNANDAPTKVLLSSNTILENNMVGATIGSLSAIDEDANESFTYQLATSGSNDNAFFAVIGNELRIMVASDFETKPWYSITVVATDKAGENVQSTFNIEVLKENEAPIMDADLSYQVSEDQRSGFVLGTLTATDADAGDILTFSIVSPALVPFSVVQGNTLILSGKLDYEIQSAYKFDVRVTDAGGLSSVEEITVWVEDVVEAMQKVTASNFLSPNGDGKNDFFIIDNVDLYRDYSLTVYSASGTKIFEQASNYENDWNATFNGDPLATGTYYYVLVNNSDSRLHFGGSFTITNN